MSNPDTAKGSPTDFAAAMANKQVTAVLGADEYQALLKASHEVGVHTSELIREATIAWIRTNFPEAERLLSAVDVASHHAKMPMTNVPPGHGFEPRPDMPRQPTRPL